VVGGPEAPSGRYDPVYLRWLKEMSSHVNGCQEVLFSGCEGAVLEFGL
jgi:hypothetical protein